MPPWSSRLLSPGSRNEPASNPNTNAHTGANTTSLDSASPARFHSRLTESDILDNAYGIPTLAPQHHNPSNSKPSRTNSHGRSLSHPFPSLFSGKKKRNGESVPTGFESTDSDSTSPAKNGGNKTKTKVPDADLKTGKCMTCDATVRWPKELKVFRCTKCVTINDLKPIALEARRGDGQRVPIVVKAGTYPGAVFPPRVIPLSVEKTRQIIDKCVTSYLLERLSHDGASSPPHSPPQSPILNEDGRNQPAIEPLFSRGYAQVHPVALPSRPITNPRRPSGTRQQNASHGDYNLSKSVPFSKSSPGSFLGAQMESHGRDSQESRSHRLDLRSSGERDEDLMDGSRESAASSLFKSLEEYIITSFGSYECINASFSTIRPNMAPRAASEGGKHPMQHIPVERPARAEVHMSEMDAKTLLLGDFAENGFWWTGERSSQRSPERIRTYRGEVSRDTSEQVTLKTPRIDWAELNEWFYITVNAGRSWRRKLEDLAVSESSVLHSTPSPQELEEIETQILDAQFHVQRVLLKATESLLKRPGRPLTEPSHLRFLLIMLGNPLLYPSHPAAKVRERSRSRSRSRETRTPLETGIAETSRRTGRQTSPGRPNEIKGSSGQHSGIIKRILGLLSNVPNECHHYLVSWFARYNDSQFQRLTDLIGSFVTYRLTRQQGKKREIEHDLTAGLVPNVAGSGRGSSAALHDALGNPSQPRSSRKDTKKIQPVIYDDDWQIKAAARVMALVFSANNSGLTRRGDTRPLMALETGHSAGLAARERAHKHGQILATSDFYNTLLDYSDLVADFEAWESKRSKFAFCQYPFFLSIWAKIQIMEHDARRQMEVKAREAFFDSIMTRKTVNQYLVLKIRRDCLVEDSLKGVSEVVGTGGEEIKKGLRIEFKGEEGIDAGGLRKEWFLLLVRDVFNPEHGMFTYDEISQFCYFNPHSFETTDQFFLVGVVLGLAIYNSTILDVAFPSFAFRKLLAAAPAAASGAASHAKPTMTYTLEDLAEYRPELANGLRQLLEFDGDVEAIYCRDFVADVERYGEVVQVPLCTNGEKKPVTNANRREFVDLYVRYLLDTAVVRQFEPFKRGFFTVCGGNALSLFRPEEIELLIRGSEEPLDIASLRAVSKCENWGTKNATDTEPVIQWFWESFQTADSKDQRKLLSFVTGSDRIPAMGATNLVIKLSCLGNDSMRFPVARTCFNTLSLWRYSSKTKLENLLWRAVYESEGFGLK